MSVNPISLSLKERATFTRQLSALIDSGLPVARALKIIGNQQLPQKKVSLALNSAIEALEEGYSLSQAFSSWDPLLVSLLKAAETGGMLSDVLTRLANFYEERFRLQTKVVTTLTYPLVILFVSIMIFIGMITMILPQFAQVYERLGGEMPAYTAFWMAVSDFIRSPWGIGVGVVLMIISYGVWQQQKQFMDWLVKQLINVPLVGDVFIQFAITRFSRTLGTLLRSGIPLTQALDLASIPLFPIQEIKEQVTDGIPLHQTLQQYPRLFPEMLTAMVAVGEETGEMNKLLIKAADYYDQELEGLLSRVTALIEPAIIILLGGLIGSVVISMYLPMFQLFNQVQ